MLILVKRWLGHISNRQSRFGAKNISWDKETCFINIKRSTHQEDIIILNFYASKFMKQKQIEAQGEILAKYFSIPVSIIDTNRQETSRHE